MTVKYKVSDFAKDLNVLRSFAHILLIFDCPAVRNEEDMSE